VLLPLLKLLRYLQAQATLLGAALAHIDSFAAFAWFAQGASAAQALAKRACSTAMVAQAVSSVDVVLELPAVPTAVFANLARAKVVLAASIPDRRR
jgi:hypothetical protein